MSTKDKNSKVRVRGESQINPGIFTGKKLVYGMIHLLPLPGTPFYESGNVEKSLEKAIADVKALLLEVLMVVLFRLLTKSTQWVKMWTLLDSLRLLS